jgi:hypothetical protein
LCVSDCDHAFVEWVLVPPTSILTTITVDSVSDLDGFHSGESTTA